MEPFCVMKPITVPYRSSLLYQLLDQHGRPLPVGFLHLPKAVLFCLEQSIDLVRQVAAAMVLRPTLYVSAVLVRSWDGRGYISLSEKRRTEPCGILGVPGRKDKAGRDF